MRPDFRSVLTHGKDLRYPDAQYVRSRILDDDGIPASCQARSRDLRKGWREGNNVRHSLIHRYLRSQVGRSWDAVNSDIAHALSSDADLRRRAVDRNVEDGCHIDAKGVVRDAEGRRVWGFYVDPRDGTLRDSGPYDYGAPRHRLRNARRLLTDADCVPLTEPGDPDRRVELRRLDGVWYAFGYRRVSVPVYRSVASVRIWTGERRDMAEDLVVKRQLSSLEIRRLRLPEWVANAASLAASVAAGRDDPACVAVLEGIRAKAIAACLRRDGPPLTRDR